MTVKETLQSGRSSQKVYTTLRRLLIHSQLVPESRLGEVEWARRLRVHRAALREGMGLLVHEGLLRKGQKGGFFVPIHKQRDLNEIMEVRFILEYGAVRLLCAQSADIDIAPLENICRTMEQLVDSDMEFGFIEADRLFHRTLIRMTNNEQLIRVYEQAPLPLRPSSVHDPVTRLENCRKTIADHRALCAALLRRDVARVQALLEKHLHWDDAIAGA